MIFQIKVLPLFSLSCLKCTSAVWVFWTIEPVFYMCFLK